MSRNQKIKFYSIFVILILSLILLWPTFQFVGMNAEEIEELRVQDPAGYNSLLDRSLRLGLDLQGGTYLVLEVDLAGIPSDDHAATVQQAIKVIRNRVDQFGVSEPSITKEGANRIVVELPGLPDVERATRLINTTAMLELKLVAQQGELFSALGQIDQVLKEQRPLAGQANTAAAAEADTAISFIDEPAAAEGQEASGLLALMRGYQRGGVFIYKDDVPLAKRYLAEPAVQAAIPPGYEFIWGGRDMSDTSGRPGRLLYYCLSRVELDGTHLQGAVPEPDSERPGFFRISFTLDRDGANQFARTTERNIGRQLATILDSQIFLAPVIESRIGNGQGVITGGFSAEEAQDNAILLRAGALPATMHIEEERSVGPSLGRDSIQKGFKAGFIGFIGVIVFMMVYYRGSGLIATGALLLNLLIVMAAMAYLHATLTLPGIAGLILTIGMAVDANVLIYERIREELRRGGKDAKVRRAIQAGYDRAFSTIFDANLTTLITALALYIFGTGPIKGFAVTLSLGIIASMYTALLVSRVVFELITMRRKVETLSI
ncbi:MAG: protein translocase subunit SecD [Candidatus Krumholzibacteriota bacterium]|nr:protein translocase subunit SecD [Candidatus Krumholzibacteriota bacterium]